MFALRVIKIHGEIFQNPQTSNVYQKSSAKEQEIKHPFYALKNA